jgi:hypothetical protein
MKYSMITNIIDSNNCRRHIHYIKGFEIWIEERRREKKREEERKE